MARPKGSRNRKTMLALISELRGGEPLSARELLAEIRSNGLWHKAVEFGLAQEDGRLLVAILTYLHDHAYGSAPKSVHATLDVRHHSAEDLAKARAIAREILDSTANIITVEDQRSLP